MLAHESHCVPMAGTIQAFRVSLWITTRGRDSLWTTSGCRSITKVCVLCCVCLARVCLNYTLSVESARKSSPCGVNWFGKREKVRPAREKWLDFGVFGRAGRVFSRFGQDWAVAGRVFSRGNGWRGCWANSFARADSCPGLRRCRGRVGRVFSRFGQGEAVAGRVLYRLGWWCPCDGCWVVLLREKILPARWCGVGNAKKFALRGELVRETRKSSPCSGKMARFWCFWARWESFFAVWPRLGCCWASFFARERLEGRAGRVLSRVLTRAPG